MRPIQLQIRKKTLVPTKRQINNKWRSDWVTVAKISYQESVEIFRTINGTGRLTRDSEFAKEIYDSFGAGIYHVNAWRPRHKGIISFFFVECYDDGFARTKKSMSSEQKDKRDNVLKLRRLKRELTELQGWEKDGKEEEIAELQEELGFDTELVKLMQPTSITSQYLTTTKPIYRFHAYEDYRNPSAQEQYQDPYDYQPTYEEIPPPVPDTDSSIPPPVPDLDWFY